MTSAPPAFSTPSLRNMPVTMAWGVGDERARLLAKLNIFTVEDLLLHRPRRYEDRRTFLSIRDLQLKEPATVRGKIVAAGVKRWKRSARAMFECVFDDGSAHLHCRWWHAQPWMEEYFAAGREFLVFGKPESLRPRTVDHPETEPLEPGEEFIHVNRIVPIHPLTDGLTARVMRTLVWHALERFEAQISEPQLVELMPPSAVPGGGDRKPEIPQGFPSRANAVRMLHFPEAMNDVETARRRLALDEFIALQAQIRVRRHNFQTKARAIPCGGDNALIKPFLARLQFKLTNAQTQVLREIRSDMRARHPMRRLLQGDVGSGKTVVAACSALMAIESGRSVALMAPTEILAEQHFENFKKWFVPLGIRVEFRTGSRKTGKESMAVNQGQTSSRVLQPRPSMFIGTHALLTENFTLPDLGLVIIDEQHKFGVAQREQLVRKGNYPHLLVMTATPIPRTLGLTVYGELDISVINEMPRGRGRIQTFIRTAETLPKVWEFIRKKLTEDRQAYVIYPRIEDSEQNTIKAVIKEHGAIQRSLAPFNVGLLHGRMTGREKDDVMTGFRANKLQVLMSTSLIEVGVDVPNATVMLIENAEQFGLAQLHQLRGRIGRGAHDSYCILVSSAQDEAARERLKILEETTDGFRVAEADLKLRGPGELLGQQQSGVPSFRFGDLASDWELIKLARRVITAEGR